MSGRGREGEGVVGGMQTHTAATHTWQMEQDPQQPPMRMSVQQVSSWFTL